MNEFMTDAKKKEHLIRLLRTVISTLNGNEVKNLEAQYNFNRDMTTIYGENGLAVEYIPSGLSHRKVDLHISFEY